MRKSATDIMQDILFAATLDAIAAFKAASKNVPNALLRDLNALHPNTAIGDLPAEAQAVIAKSVRDAFTRLLKHGYAIGPATPGARPERTAPRSDRPTGAHPPRRGPGKPPIVEIKRPPRRTGPPPKKP